MRLKHNFTTLKPRLSFHVTFTCALCLSLFVRVHFFGLAETAEFIFESTAFNSLFFFSEQRRVTLEIRCISCSSFFMCYNTVKPLSLLTPLYNKQLFCKNTYVTKQYPHYIAMIIIISVRIIEVCAL